jgi:hypothetical protein
VAAGLAISSVGSIVVTSSQTARTLSINPTIIGNLVGLVGVVENTSSATQISAVTGGHCVGLDGGSGWTQLIAASANVGASVKQISLWAGVATATGAQNATVTTTAGSGNWVDLAARQFTCASVSASTDWATDGAPNSRSNGSSSTTVTYPPLTPSDTGRMYLGFGYVSNTSITTGATSGYTVALDDVDNAVMFNPAVTGAQTPITKTSGSGTSMALGALLYAVNPVPDRGSGWFPYCAPGHHTDELTDRRRLHVPHRSRRALLRAA